MNKQYKNHLLIQTFVELDSQIAGLTHKISADRFIEIGDDPHLIREIENILLHAENRVKSIEPIFDLSITPLSQANLYFALIKHINDALRYLREIRRKDYGCQQHTYELLERLRNCSNSIDAMGDLVATNTEVIH